jgi:hypothetical protein
MTQIPVRATINLPGLARGKEALVDPDDPYIAGCLERGRLVRIPPEDRAADIPADDGPVDDEPQTDEAAPPDEPALEPEPPADAPPDAPPA